MFFFEKIYEIVKTIPYGTVMSYGQVARLAGNGRMARQVGWAMRACGPEIPWHRVVNRQGRLIPDPDGKVRQRKLLEEEGILFTEAGLVAPECFCLK